MQDIASYMERWEAMKEALVRWSIEHEGGRSWFVGEIGDDVNELDEDLQAELILAAGSNRELAVYRVPDGSEVAVADVGGPWAAVVTPAGDAAAR